MSAIGKGMTSGRPIDLIFTEKGPDGHHRLALNPEALKELKDIDEKLVVIAAVGPYRTGKSYLLSRLAMASGSQGSTFEVGHTCEPKTKGLRIMLLNHPSMPGHKLLLVDTEGIGDTNKGDSQHDANVFVLTCLLSTILIYNGKNAIDEDTIKQFGFTAEMSRYVVSRSGQGGNRDVSEFFPELVYVVRDFSLDLKVDGNVKTPDEYLEHALATNAGDAKDRVNVRQTITKYFKRRRCFTLDLPAANKRVLQRLDSLEDEGLNEEFVCSMKDLFAYLMLERAGQHLNGKQLALLAETIVNSFERNEVPNISSAMDILKNQENKRVMDSAERLYETRMEKLELPTEMKTVSKIHQAVSRKAFAQVKKEAILDSIEERDILKAFQARLDAKEAYYKNKNARISQELCLRTLNELYSGVIHERQTTGAYTCPGGHQKYREDMLHVEWQYGAMIGLGPRKEEVLAMFREEKRSDHDTILETDRRLTKQENEIIEQKRRKAEAERQRKAAEKRRKELEAIERANEERERQNQVKAEALMRELEEAKRRRGLVFTSVQSGDACPADALTAPDIKDSVVCLWDGGEEGTFGRGDVDHHISGLQAWFPWGGDEYDSENLHSGFKVACRNSDFEYTWEEISVVEQLHETTVFEVNGYCPAVVEGLLGKADIRRGLAWTTWAGTEICHTGYSFNTALALCVKMR